MDTLKNKQHKAKSSSDKKTQKRDKKITLTVNRNKKKMKTFNVKGITQMIN